jgi:hypothetical protein
MMIIAAAWATYVSVVSLIYHIGKEAHSFLSADTLTILSTTPTIRRPISRFFNFITLLTIRIIDRLLRYTLLANRWCSSDRTSVSDAHRSARNGRRQVR